MSEAFQVFSEEVFDEGALSVETKQLMAVAVAYTIQCEDSIAVRSEYAREAGATDAEIMEAVWVAAEMCTGGAYAHAALSSASAPTAKPPRRTGLGSSSIARGRLE